MVFIRAPKIERIGHGVEVIATEGADPVAVRQGKAMAATFHPELSEDTRVHRAFLDLVSNGHKNVRRQGAISAQVILCRFDAIASAPRRAKGRP